MRTSNLAIVFTDIVGYADRLSRQTYEQSQRMLRLHEALVLPVFRAYRGRRVKSIGGTLLVTFESPTDAVLCASAVQDRIWERSEEHTSELQSLAYLVCRLLLEKKKKNKIHYSQIAPKKIAR